MRAVTINMHPNRELRRRSGEEGDCPHPRNPTVRYVGDRIMLVDNKCHPFLRSTDAHDD